MFTVTVFYSKGIGIYQNFAIKALKILLQDV